MELDYNAIGRRIRAVRRRVPMTQETLAGKIDVSTSHISNVERGSVVPSLEVIVKIANALSVTADDLLCDEVIRCRPQFEQDIQRLLDECDDYEIRIVKNMMEAIIPAIRRDAHLRSIEKEP